MCKIEKESPDVDYREFKTELILCINILLKSPNFKLLLKTVNFLQNGNFLTRNIITKIQLQTSQWNCFRATMTKLLCTKEDL